MESYGEIGRVPVNLCRIILFANKADNIVYLPADIYQRISEIGNHLAAG